MKNKKGVAGIILTIIMIVLVLAAAVIVWGIISNFLQTQTGEIDTSTKCLKIDIQTTKLLCSGVLNDVCDVTVSRDAKGDDIAGIKLVFTNASGETNYVHDVVGNIAPLETKTIPSISTGITNVNKVDVVAYFTDVSGNELLC